MLPCENKLILQVKIYNYVIYYVLYYVHLSNIHIKALFQMLVHYLDRKDPVFHFLEDFCSVLRNFGFFYYI